jgi:hypothetical protein
MAAPFLFARGSGTGNEGKFSTVAELSHSNPVISVQNVELERRANTVSTGYEGHATPGSVMHETEWSGEALCQQWRKT